MARAALKSKQGKLYEKKFATGEKLKQAKLKQPTKFYNRCRLCGRSKAYVRDFGICRVCLRRYAREGLIMGLRKASR